MRALRIPLLALLALAYLHPALAAYGAVLFVTGFGLARIGRKRELRRLVNESAKEVSRLMRRVDQSQEITDKVLREHARAYRFEESEVGKAAKDAPAWEPDGRGGWEPVK